MQEALCPVLSKRWMDWTFEITGFVNVILTRIYVNSVKVPDAAIFPGRRMWPSIAFEFDYAEPYDYLKEDVKLLLEGTEGKIFEGDNHQTTTVKGRGDGNSSGVCRDLAFGRGTQKKRGEER